MADFLKSLLVKGIEIDTAGAVTGDVLKFNGTKFGAASAGGGSSVGALDDLSDVVITSPEEFQGLSYNGTSWVNSHIPLVSYVRNAESTTITTGTVVYLFGATGDHATVKRADKSSDTTSSKTIGVAGANITASNNGPIVTRGYVDGIDLSVGYTAGDILWLGDDGAFTKTKPTAPDHLVFVGVVVRATNNGIIYVATQNGYELDELHNVSLPSPNSGDFLKYNGSIWVADAIDLGTDTVGNYVATITAGTGVSTTGASTGEGIAHTISIGQSVATNASPAFAGLNIDSGTLYVDATNNRVGILDTSPDYTLDIDNGQINVDDDSDPDYYKYARIGATSARVVSYDKNNLVEDTASVIAPGSITVESQGASVAATLSSSSLSFADGANYIVIDPTTLTANRTLTLPNASGTVALITVSDTAPSAPAAGSLWFKSDTGNLLVYYDSYWIDAAAPAYGTLDGGTA